MNHDEHHDSVTTGEQSIATVSQDDRGRFELPLGEHVHRRADVDPRAAKMAERQVAIMFGLSAVFAVLAIVAFVVFEAADIVWLPVIGRTSALNAALGTCIGLSIFLIGAGAIQWAKKLMPDEEVIDERHGFAGTDEERSEAVAVFERGVAESGIKNRPLIRRTLLGAMALFPLPILALFADLGPAPGTRLRYTMWGDRPRTRIINQASGAFVRPGDLAVGGLINAVPEGLEEVEKAEHNLNERGKSAIILVRMDPSEIQSQQGDGWAYEGILAYSKICTHMGCPISLYQQRTHHLLCPCHQSTFDLSDAGRAIFGPARRWMPQLALDVDSEGYLVALGDFAEPVGPSFWERG
jgi:ubiquinol-cytochrome c reductase iron-sulfur subunit